MKGKKSDPAFVATFIAESIQQGLVTPETMLERAKLMIGQIDDQIKTIEAKKAIRSKLLDVVETFEKSQEKPRADSIALLPQFQFDYPAVCHSICQELYETDIGGLTFNMLSGQVYRNGQGANYLNIKFSIKQLLLAKVIESREDRFFQGPQFAKYKNPLKENPK